VNGWRIFPIFLILPKSYPSTFQLSSTLFSRRIACYFLVLSRRSTTMALCRLLAVALLCTITVRGLHLLHFSDFHYDPYFGTGKAVGPCKHSG